MYDISLKEDERWTLSELWPKFLFDDDCPTEITVDELYSMWADKYVNDTSSDKDRDTYKDKDKQKTETTTQRTGYKTGDFLPYVLGVVFLVLVIAAIIVYRKRKKQ